MFNLKYYLGIGKVIIPERFGRRRAWQCDTFTGPNVIEGLYPRKMEFYSMGNGNNLSMIMTETVLFDRIELYSDTRYRLDLILLRNNTNRSRLDLI